MAESILTVSQLNAAVRDLLEGQIGAVRVRGEISNLRRQSSGHIYFTLKDADSQIRAVMFRGAASQLRFVPADGQGVTVEGELSVYEPRGEYQIRVLRIIPEGKGGLQEQFEALKRKLQAEGLFAAERKKALPLFPQKIAIITSPTGAALRDFLQICQRRCPHLQIQVFGVRVQGEGAAAEVARALTELNRMAEAEVIVVARGGGSLEDLWAFNEEIVARAVAASAIPVISGVGHEIDFTICDFAADLRAPTPSAAAELVSLADAEWRERLIGMRADLQRGAAAYLQQCRWRVTANRDHYVLREPVRIVEQLGQRLDDLAATLNRNLKQSALRVSEQLQNLRRRWTLAGPSRRLTELRQQLSARADQLRLLSPQQTLNRGYAMVSNARGEILRNKAALIAAKTIKIQVTDGKVSAQIQE